MGSELPARRPSVLAIDDSPEILFLLNELLQEEYEVILARDGTVALRILAKNPDIDLILLDIRMPGIDGYEVCTKIKANPELAAIPLIFLTALGDLSQQLEGFKVGAVDYITKPILAETLLARVRTHVRLHRANQLLCDQNRYLDHLVIERTYEIAQLRDATILSMASLAEFRDNETGNHLRRTQHYVGALARQLRFESAYSDELTDTNIHWLMKSAPLHDIGKVGIPDRILMKPNRLTEQEFAIMKTHPVIGRDAIDAVKRELGTSNKFLRYASEIAYSHHEKFDGSGYPLGLTGVTIPLSARLMAAADVYDALISRRIYKSAFTHESSVAIIEAGKNKHFDPAIVEAVLSAQHEFKAIAERYPDIPESIHA